ncbi:MAG: Asp-tRNA(Asn)/Glu-tRNA(Gln) amidotransferase subunit GatB [Candidatus Latescibacterota bacterium]|nr:MAG: Asp-tRNA(Asn)/Glu-tRNA(Gln) amidotransferase subunit GatB [Candidatus Latescibacterota bacterium]
MNERGYEAVIGLEVHAQLVTATKIFCGCPAVYGADPNTLVCPVCLGLPGALPVLNREAVAMAVRMGLATGCRVAGLSVFARKNYFYPDCPKNYQISMYDRPLCEDGFVEFELGGEARRVGIERIHLEEDAGKLLHDAGGGSLVDFNRCGVPLIEIVSRPEIRSPEEASTYLVTLRRILRYLEICDGNMEEGSLRCDVNVSVRRAGETALGTKTEIKNLNSFRAVEMGIRWEIDRQIETLSKGGRIEQVTNLWDAASKRLVQMRSKEQAHDYRYFPEPDLRPLEAAAEWMESLRRSLPELPVDRERRLRRHYGIPPYDASVLCGEKGLADYFEAVAGAGADAKLAANWIMREVLEEMKSGSTAPRSDAGAVPSAGPFGFEAPLDPSRLAGLIALVKKSAVSGSAARDAFKEMVRSGESAETVVARLGLAQESDSAALEKWIDEVIAENPDEAARYRAGKTALLGFFVGQVMKKSRGTANPKLTGELVRAKLGS